jgi:molybdopterin-guanine dinucleotide biosynthesis protein A
VSRAQISGIVLAGGKSVRMGSDKGRLTIDGTSLLDRALRTIDGLVDDVVISVRDVSTREREGDAGRVRVVRDDVPERGPLGGLLTSLRRVHHPRALVVAVDMPLLTKNLLAYLIDTSWGWDITVPRWRDRVEPLAGVYDRGCAPHIERFLQRPSASARDFVLMTDLGVRFVEDREIRRFGSPGRLFFNVNTPEDAQEAERLLRAQARHPSRRTRRSP